MPILFARRSGAALALLLPLLLASAEPASAASKPRRTKVAVLDVRATGGIDAASVEGLSSLIGSEVSARRDLEVSTSADLRTLVGFDRQRQLLGCTETSCLAEIAGAVGADYLLFTEASRVGTIWLLSMTLLDAKRARGTARLTRKAKSLNDLVGLASEMVAEALRPLPSADPRAATAQPAVPEAPKLDLPVAKVAPLEPAPPGVEQPSSPAPEPGWSRRSWGYVVGGAGLAAVAGGAVAGLQAMSANTRQEDAARALDQSTFEAARTDVRTWRITADALYVAGAVGVAAGLWLFVSGDEEPAVGLAPVKGGAVAVLAGGF